MQSVSTRLNLTLWFPNSTLNIVPFLDSHSSSSHNLVALEFDSWGQIDEAQQEYSQCISHLARASQQLNLRPWEIVLFKQIELLILYRQYLLDPEKSLVTSPPSAQHQSSSTPDSIPSPTSINHHNSSSNNDANLAPPPQKSKKMKVRVYATDLETCIDHLQCIFKEEVPQEKKLLSTDLREKVSLIQQQEAGVGISLAESMIGMATSISTGTASGTNSRRSSARLSRHSFNALSSSSHNSMTLDSPDGQPSNLTSNYEGATNQYLLDAPIGMPGYTFVKLFLDTIGLKDALGLFDPFIEISLVDGEGQNLETPQKTAASTDRESTLIRYLTDVYIQTPVNNLPEGSAIYFELKHYKPKKKKISTKCFAFLPVSQLENGSHQLQLYKKPTQWKRRKLKLHTKKPLFLDVTVSLLKY